MTLSSETKYPSSRSYVLKVRNDAKPDALKGRLEHLVTGRTHVFVSAQDLLQSIGTDLQYDDDGSDAHAVEANERNIR